MQEIEEHKIPGILNQRLDSVCDSNKEAFCFIYDADFDEIYKNKNKPGIFERLTSLPNFNSLVKIRPNHKNLYKDFLNENYSKVFSAEYKICFILLRLPACISVPCLRMIYQLISRARVFCYLMLVVDSTLDVATPVSNELPLKRSSVHSFPQDSIESFVYPLELLFNVLEEARVTFYGQKNLCTTKLNQKFTKNNDALQNFYDNPIRNSDS